MSIRRASSHPEIAQDISGCHQDDLDYHRISSHVIPLNPANSSAWLCNLISIRRACSHPKCPDAQTQVFDNNKNRRSKRQHPAPTWIKCQFHNIPQSCNTCVSQTCHWKWNPLLRSGQKRMRQYRLSIVSNCFWLSPWRAISINNWWHNSKNPMTCGKYNTNWLLCLRNLGMHGGGGDFRDVPIQVRV